MEARRQIAAEQVSSSDMVVKVGVPQAFMAWQQEEFQWWMAASTGRLETEGFLCIFGPATGAYSPGSVSGNKASSLFGSCIWVQVAV